MGPCLASWTVVPESSLKRRFGSGGRSNLAGRGSALWRFKADAHARFVGRMCAPGRRGEPQSTGSEQRRYCQEQMFCFHCF